MANTKNDYDFEQFIKLLDGALASDNDNIKQALRKFLFVAAMVLGDDCEPGPFTKMMETIDTLQRRVGTLESAGTSYADTGGYTYTTPGTWNVIGTSATTNISTSTSITLPSSGTTQWYTSNEITGTTMKNDINDMLSTLAQSA